MSAAARRILFLEHNVDGTVGGSHICLLDICRHLDRSRYHPIVWLFQENALVHEYRRCGAEVVIERPPDPVMLANSRAHGSWRGPLGLIQSIANVFRTLVTRKRWWLERLRRHDVALVHLNNTASTDVDLQLAARAARIPCVAHQRGFAEEWDWLTIRIARRLSAIIAISTSIREHLIRRGFAGYNVQLVFDGVDPDRIVAAQRSGAADQPGLEAALTDGPVIGIVGNVKRWKGQEVVVRAYAKLRSSHPKLTCVIVGAVADRKYEANLRQTAKELGVADRLVFVGYHPRPPALMGQMDVILHASIQPEPFGIVLLEAMAIGKPVVAARAGGPLDIVMDGVTGFLAKPGDPDDYAAKIGEALADDERRRSMGQAGRARMLELFTVHTNIRAIERIYETLLGSAS